METTQRTTSSYRKIVSSTAIFGGAQFVNVVINIIRGKLVAFILHSTGMGMMSLLQNAANTVQQFALLGINISAVRNISQTEKEGSAEALAMTVRIVRTLIFIVSCLGLLSTIVFSPLMSKLSFGTTEYVSLFLLLSLSVFVTMMGTGEMAVMQGLQRYKQLAFCSIVPPICGLLISIPIYYVWGIQGIVPAMIVSGAIYYTVMRFYSYRDKRVRADRPRLTLREVWTEGQGIIRFGLVMTIGTMVGAITTYALTAFISNAGSVSDVGFYQAANFISMQYISMIFTAMATDYYPRLSALIQNHTTEAHQLVNQQTEIVLLIVTPLAMLMILTAPLLITLLLTDEFLAIRTLISFMGLACIFKALCFPMDYIAYAKGDKQYILWVETIWGNAKTFCVIAGCYYFYGLDGLGYGALASAIIDVMVSIVLMRLRYGFRHSAVAIRMLVTMLMLAIACFTAAFLSDAWVSYGVMSATTAVCMVYSFVQLNSRLDIRSIINRFTKGRNSEEKA